MLYRNPVFYVLAAGIAAFVLMMLTICSVPISSLYFLYTTEALGVRFGMWGWCLDEDGTCSWPWQLGYTWEPQLSNTITKALVFYPITAVSIILTMISLIPIAYARNARADRVFRILAWISFTSSIFAFSFMIGMWSIAKYRFEKRGFSASYGLLPWLSLTATILLLAVALGPFIFGPLPKVGEQNTSKRLRRVKNFQDLEASARRKHRQQSRHTNIKSPSL